MACALHAVYRVKNTFLNTTHRYMSASLWLSHESLSLALPLSCDMQLIAKKFKYYRRASTAAPSVTSAEEIVLRAAAAAAAAAAAGSWHDAAELLSHTRTLHAARQLMSLQLNTLKMPTKARRSIIVYNKPAIFTINVDDEYRYVSRKSTCLLYAKHHRRPYRPLFSNRTTIPQ